jgi:hypothetical protein
MPVGSPSTRLMAARALAWLALVIAPLGPVRAQGTVPGQFVVPLGFCQLGVTALTSAVKLSSCVSASFTASAATDPTQLVVTSVTGFIRPGQIIISGTGITAGTVINSQVSGTTGGAGTYQLSASNTASSASTTSGGVPPGATMASLDAETANVRYRDDGGAPTASVGTLIVAATPPAFYTGTLAALQFIAASGSPLLNVSFYR